MPRGHRRVPPASETIIVDGDVEEYVLLEDVVDDGRFEAIIDDMDGEAIFQDGDPHVVLEASGGSERSAALLTGQRGGSCCLVCHREPSASVRLFRWPRDPEVRKNWCQIFELPPESVEGANAFICSWHFAPDQFICCGSKIYWAPNAQPSFVLERNFHVDFVYPWQPGYVTPVDRPNGPMRSRQDPKGLKRKNRPPPPGIQVFFRDSNYKVKGKQTHPVAILPIPTNPDQFYEFSLNRTSRDGTGFYACLSCRKAKAETREKDIVRTIHLSAPQPHKKAVLLSKLDPFSGHHYACSPLTIAHEEVEHAPFEAPSTSQEVYGIAHSPNGNHLDGQLWEEVDNIDSLISSEDPGVTFMLQEDQVVFATNNGEDPPVFPEDTAPRGLPAFYRLPRLRRKAKKDRKPSCYICFKKLPGAKQLALHLLDHVKARKKCRRCGRKLPFGAENRKRTTCSGCLRKRVKVEDDASGT
uniref:THAP-type domain-containing protein n=1 Tax=Steinernema glaseri TaxID=37863 RepID=A0A1I7YW03_9BILA